MRRFRFHVVLITLLVWGCAFPATAQNRKTGRTQAPRAAANPNRANNPPRNPAEELRRFQDMSPDQREKALAKLPMARRQRLEQQLQRFENMPPAQRERAMRRLEALQSLAPERRVAIRQQIQELRGLPPKERRQWLNSEEMKQNFSPEEQRLLRESFNLPPNS